MTPLFDRRPQVPPEVRASAALARTDRVLAAATTDDGTWLLGTRDALVIVPPASPDSTGTTTDRIPWERVASADWEREEERLRVLEVGEFGRHRPVHVFALPDPGPLLPMVRERVTASVLLSRRVPVLSRRKGLRVIARRAPHGRGDIIWTYELDPGVDPDDPLVREAAAVALRDAERELGDQESSG